MRICFVCLGNICRSPTAEGVMAHLVRQADLHAHIEVESAGTGGWHVGERADVRSRRAAERRGLDLSSRARQFVAADFDRFDYIVAMDTQNRADLLTLAGPRPVTVHLLRDFDPASPRGAGVPDPYYGGEHGFDEVLNLCEAACRGLLAHIRREHDL